MLYFLGSFHKSGDKMKNKNYHTFGTGPKSNRKTKTTTPSDQF